MKQTKIKNNGKEENFTCWAMGKDSRLRQGNYGKKQI